MGRIAWGSLLIGIALGFLLRHFLKGRTAVTS
jgi:hypothetical protein